MMISNLIIYANALAEARRYPPRPRTRPLIHLAWCFKYQIHLVQTNSIHIIHGDAPAEVRRNAPPPPTYDHQYKSLGFSGEFSRFRVSGLRFQVSVFRIALQGLGSGVQD